MTHEGSKTAIVLFPSLIIGNGEDSSQLESRFEREIKQDDIFNYIHNLAQSLGRQADYKYRDIL